MKLISLNVGLPRARHCTTATTINTGIFKKPVSGPVPLRTLNLDGDRQADLACTAGPTRQSMHILRSTTSTGARNCPDAIFPGACSARISPPRDCSRTIFTSGTVCRSGRRSSCAATALPCYKLAAKFQRNDISSASCAAAAAGSISRWNRKGVEAGDSFELLSREPKASRSRR